MAHTKKKTKKPAKPTSLISPLRFTRKTVWTAVLVVGVVGALLLIKSFAATSAPPTGAYVGGLNPSGANRFATTYLDKSSSDVALEFAAMGSWADIEGPGWLLDPWKNGGYSKKMVLTVPMLPANSGSLAEGAAGNYNAHFKTLAQNLVNAGMNNAVLRIGWEFNGNWYRWSAANGQANNFITYWKQIVNTMRAVPGANFKFNWNPTNGTGALAQPEQAYPGDAYVDQIGLDVYNQSWAPNYTDPTARWNDISFGNRGLRYWVDFAASKGKPISFPEWGTGTRPDGHGGGDDPAFIQNMYNTMISTDTAFNTYWDYCASDFCAALSNNPKSSSKFKELFRGGSYSPAPTPAPAPAAPTVGLNAKPTSIVSGNSTTLTWSSTNATSCTASGGWSGMQNASGSVSLKPNTTTTYNLSCTGSGGSASASSKVTVTAPPTTTPAPTVNLTASSSSIEKGKNTTLTWSSTNATSCTASGGWSGSKPTSGNTTVAPTASTSYTLTCSGPGGQVSDTKTVNVTAPPAPPAPAPIPATTLVIKPTPTGTNNQVSGTVTLSLPKANQANVSRIEYSVDSTVKKSSRKASTAYKVDTTRLSNGVHTFTVKVTDKNGNISVGSKQVYTYNKPSWFRRTWNSFRSWF